MSRHRPRLLLGGVVLLALVGCASLPDGGDLQEAEGGSFPHDASLRYVPPGPADGASPREVVAGFVEAVLASPVQLSVARQFLTPDAAAEWRPSRRLLIYQEARPTVEGAHARIALRGVDWVDDGGRWHGAFEGGRTTVGVDLVRRNGEWRISRLPDVLAVQRDWFRRHYVHQHVWFLAPDGGGLVPEPILVPRGEQLVTALVRSLIAGPRDPDATWLSSRLSGLSLSQGAASVVQGVARISLTGGAAPETPEARNELAAQLTATLGQISGVEAVEIRINANPLTLGGGLTEIPVHSARTPMRAATSEDLYGVLDGRPVRLTGDARVLGAPLGGAGLVRALAVDPTGHRGAVVRADGREARVAPLNGSEPGVRLSGEGFLQPVWDLPGHCWLVDRGARGAVVQAVVRGRAVGVVVPGVTGTDVVDVLVSRDGTRMVTGVRTGADVSIRVSRIHWTAAGVTVTAAREVARVPGLRDLAWHGSTEIVGLAVSGLQTTVHWMALDGSPHELGSTVAPDVLGIDGGYVVSAEDADLPAWAISEDGSVIDLGSRPLAPDHPALGLPGLTGVTYAG